MRLHLGKHWNATWKAPQYSPQKIKGNYINVPEEIDLNSPNDKKNPWTFCLKSLNYTRKIVLIGFHAFDVADSSVGNFKICVPIICEILRDYNIAQLVFWSQSSP